MRHFSRRNPRPPARYQPRLESLEDRSVPSAASLDPSFGNGGLVTTNLGSSNEGAHNVVQQPDGKLVAVGYTTEKSGIEDFAVVRYNPDGRLDSTFGSGGIVKTTITSTYWGAYANAVAVASDGKIVVAGVAHVDARSYIEDAFAVARYNPDGSLDKTFGNRKGFVITNIGPGQDGANAIVQQADGRILVGGGAGGDFCVIRYAANGTLDTSFGGTGIVTTDFQSLQPPGLTYSNESVGSLMLRPLPGGGQQITAVGGTDGAFALARYNPNGTLDTSFGAGGQQRIGGAVPIAVISAVMQSGGEVVLAGKLKYGNYQDIVVARVDGAGNLDPTFGSNGTVTYHRDAITNSDGSQTIYSESSLGLRVDATTGTIVLGGGQNITTVDPQGNTSGSSNSLLLLHFTSNGALDTSFGTGGVATSLPFDASLSLGGLLFQSDGNIVLAGLVTQGSVRDFALARYLG
jgi:uncharacterized delta-60 repeat protein